MSDTKKLKKLLQNQAIWQASDKNNSIPTLSTGYSALDEQLHYRGWPQGTLSELLLSHNGIGEIRLLLPLLSYLNQGTGYICWVNPPYLPYPAALSAQGLHINKMLLIRAKTLQDTIWSTQQAMASKSCAAVLVWLPQKALLTEVRKLKLAAKTGNCWGIILRNQSLQQQVSPAALRILMELNNCQQVLKIIKQPGGWSGQQITLNLFPEQKYWNSLPSTQWPMFSPPRTNLNIKTQTDNLLYQPQKPGFAKQSSVYH